ncbi:MAG: RluA family pseudouridine synthase [Chloroflexota bacterium]|nr:RluA family pseudouridine synthase [Chloroflexota bacterium]
MDEKLIELEVVKGGKRVDKYIALKVPDLSRSQVQRLIEEGLVKVNGQVAKPSYRVEVGDLVVIRVPPPKPLEIRPQPIPLDIVYEDEDIVVVNKPAGMVVHPGPGHRKGTLVGALLARYPDLAGVGQKLRPGIVHRLDKGSSGLLVVARNEEALRNLQGQFKRRQVEKTYLVLIEGRLEPRQGVIEAPIGRDPKHRKRMAVVKDGKPARTDYKVLEYLDQHTLVEVKPVTGRTHQVRVHFAAIDHPLVGDPVYGFRKQRLGLKRQFLHAWKIGFALPSTGEQVEFTAELAGDLQDVLESLREVEP